MPARPRCARGGAGLLAGVLLTMLAACGGSSAAGASRSSGDADLAEAGPVASPGPGFQLISSLGLVVEAPADWPINAWNGCSPAPPAQILRGSGAAFGCGNDNRPASELVIGTNSVDPVSANPPHRTPAPDASPTVEKRRLDGVPVTISRTRLADGRTHASLDATERGVRLDVTSADAAVVDHALATARLVATDPAGCETAQPVDPVWDVRRSGPAVTLTSAAFPTAIVVCHYQSTEAGRNSSPPTGATSTSSTTGASGGVLGSSAVLIGDSATKAVEAIERAAPGPVADVPAAQCLAEPDREPLWLHVRYANRPDHRRTGALQHLPGSLDRHGARHLARHRRPGGCTVTPAADRLRVPRSATAHLTPSPVQSGSQPCGPILRPSRSRRILWPLCRSWWLPSQVRTASSRLVVWHRGSRGCRGGARGGCWCGRGGSRRLGSGSRLGAVGLGVRGLSGSVRCGWLPAPAGPGSRM